MGFRVEADLEGGELLGEKGGVHVALRILEHGRQLRQARGVFMSRVVQGSGVRVEGVGFRDP